MKFGKVLLITLFLVSGTFEEVEIEITPERTEEIYLLTDKHIHRIVNAIFRNLMLTPYFLTSKQVQKELQKYKYLRNTASINYKIYKYIGNTSQSTDKKSYIDNDINDTINDILNETFTFSNIDTILKEEFLSYVVGQTRRLNNFERYNDLSFELILDFLNKLNDMRKEGFLKTKRKEIDDNLKTRTEIAQSIVGVDMWTPNSKEVGDNRRLYRARTTSIRNYSFMASIAMDGAVLCAGSIISADTIITAASCLQKLFIDAQEGRKLSLVTVRVGSNYDDSSGDLIPARGAIFHPDYNPFNLYNNIVLLRLRITDFVQSKWIKRIPLDRQGFDLQPMFDKETKIFKVLGWGQRNSRVTEDRIPLSSDRLAWYDTETCRGIYTKLYVTDNNFCLGSVHSGNGACEKDLGAPAVFQGKLVGITSFSSPECGTVNSPTVFMKIAPFSAWIDEVMKDKNLTSHSRKEWPDPNQLTTTSTEEFVTSKTNVFKSGKSLLGIQIDSYSLNEMSQISKEITRSQAKTATTLVSETESDFEPETLNSDILSKIKRILTTQPPDATNMSSIFNLNKNIVNTTFPQKDADYTQMPKKNGEDNIDLSIEIQKYYGKDY